MKTIYLSRDFRVVVVSTYKPGDIYNDPRFGECRRVTASRLCLAGERAGIDSEAFQELLKAISDVAENDQYDGRAVESWFGLVGLVLQLQIIFHLSLVMAYLRDSLVLSPPV